MKLGRSRLSGALVIAMIATRAFSQAPQETKPSFEVASVKPNVSGDGFCCDSTPGRFVAKGIPLRMLISQAYKVRDFQIVGGPDWINTDRWDIEAKFEPEENAASTQTGFPDPNQLGRGELMLQSLIEERFQLRFHRETRELPVYELTVAKDGPKIKLSANQKPFQFSDEGIQSSPPPRMRMGRGSIEATGWPLLSFIPLLSQQLDRVVIDKTDLKGFYDIKLQWSPGLRGAELLGVLPPGTQPPPPPVDQPRPSVFTAIQEQLGLRLQSTKGPAEVIVIDSVRRASVN